MTTTPPPRSPRRLHSRALAGLLLLVLLAGGLFVLLRPGVEEGPAPMAPVKATEANFASAVLGRGFDGPVWVGPAPGERTDVLWVAERTGRLIRASGDGLERRTTWIDLSGRVSTGPEQGLLGVAFSPDFDRTRLVVISYTDPAGDSHIEEWSLGASPSAARRIRSLLTVDQPFPNHNGGHVTFGPHRTLYTGFGDGGGAFDPDDRAQDPAERLGKILSADLSKPGPVTWSNVATGARNPWRFWYDPALGEMWIGDVGQDVVEEVDRIRLDTSTEVPNLGWSLYEGGSRVDDGGREIRGTQDLSWPVASYDHSAGRCSVTGGVIYRGPRVPALRGRYVLADFCTGEIFSLLPGAGMSASDLRLELPAVSQPAHIGLDADGELIVASLDGTIHRLVAPR